MSHIWGRADWGRGDGDSARGSPCPMSSVFVWRGYTVRTKASGVLVVAFWVTNPCRITRNVEQTNDVRMYIEEYLF